MQISFTISSKTKYDNPHKLYWYDAKQKKMLEMNGDYISFKYDSKTKSNIPYAESIKKEDRIEEYDVIKKWILDNARQYDISVVYDSKKKIIIDFDDDYADGLTRDLYTRRIRWNEV